VPGASGAYPPAVIIRTRADSDLHACVALLLAVHVADAYPRHLPADVAGFLSPDHETDAWVAEACGEILGHVALHRAADDPTLAAAQRATGLAPSRLAVVARLLVSPGHRRQGVGQALLTTAMARACARGQRAVLDVVQDATAPVALYEATGWQRLEPLQLPLPGGVRLDLWVYLSPP
jgi:GNAT superfamily N-acetyltransferase